MNVARNVMVVGEGSVGETLYTGAAQGGAQAMRRDAGEIAVGKLADLVAIDSTDPALCMLREDQVLDGLVFAAKDTVVSDLWSAGRHMVKDGAHVAREAILSRYRTEMDALIRSI